MLLLINDIDAGHKGNEHTNYNKNKKGVHGSLNRNGG